MAPSDKAHILYLEDDPESVELVRFLLGSAGAAVTVAESVEEALNLARSGGFDLFLLDGLLPSGYSFELCPQLRAAAPAVPIVFYTALGFPAEMQLGADAGADAYLVKPFMGNLAETLLSIIRDSKRSAYNGPAAVNYIGTAAP